MSERVQRWWDGKIVVRRTFEEDKGQTKCEMVISLPDDATELERRGAAMAEWAFRSKFEGPAIGRPPEAVEIDFVFSERTTSVFGEFVIPAHFRLKHEGLMRCRCGCTKTSIDDDSLRGYFIGMADWGFGAHQYSNPPPAPKLCTCDSERDVLMKTPWPAEIVADTGWKTTKTGRCIYDHRREVTFTRPLTEDELKLAVKKLSYGDKPIGMFFPEARLAADGVTIILTNVTDSSD